MNPSQASGTAAPHRKVACELCESAGGRVVWSGPSWRAVRVDDAAFPGFYRLIANGHVREWSELPPDARHRGMDLVCAIEGVLLERLHPAKVNLASLGNVVAHLHWHVVARFEWDSHFPQPIWAAPQREVVPPASERLGSALDGLDEAVAAALAAVG
jgi:diadenosine tetraphosphate (Ap4A) HIT family hydrolase